LSNDLNRFDRYALYLPFLFVAPVQVAVVAYYHYTVLGVSAFGGILYLLLLALLQGNFLLLT